MNEHIPDIEPYIKRLNWYLQEHYPANKKFTAEEWNALFLALINQGNAQEDTLAKICNEYLPLQIEKINTLVDTTNEHEASIAQLRTDTNKALKDSNYAVVTADTALNQVVEKMGTVAYINNVLAPSLHYTRDPQAQLDDTAQGIINLQSQIDLMEQNTNVADVVGTFVDLVNYDKSKITANDIVEVLQDETRANADTYYRLVENAWVYIGKLGSYYTRGESDALLAKKVNYADYKDTLSFAESERQKSKNLIPYPYHAGNSIVNNGITFTVNNDQSISVSGTVIDHSSNAVMWLAWDMPLKAGTYRISDSSPDNDLGVVAWIGNDYYQKDVNDGIFTLSSDATARIYLQVAKGSTKTYNDTVKFMLCEGTDTDWQPYNGAIVYEKALQNNPAIVFADSERQKSKNLFNENKYLSSYCTYASNRWTTNSTHIGYNQSILTNEAGATDNRNTSKLPLLKKGTYTLTIFNAVNNTNDTTISIALYNQDGTINGTFTTATITTNTTITFTLASDLYLDIRVTGDVGTISFDHIQVEKGSIATAYYPYSGEITHNGDAAVEFANSERQKSKNLFDLNYNGTFNSKTETSVSKYIALKSVYGEKITINTNLPQYSFSRGSVGDIYTNIIFKNLKPNTSYTISFTPISVDNDVNVHFLGVYDVQDKLNTKVTKTITTDESGRFNTGYGIWISAQNTTFTVSNVQIEEGSIATDYQPYTGAIVHEKEIADVEHIETIYDMLSSDSNINKGYTAGKQFDDNATDMPIDLGDYKKLRLCFKLYKQAIVYFDFGIPNKTYFTMCAVCMEPTYSVNNPIMLSVYYSNGNLKCYKAVLGISAGGGNLNNSDNAVLIKVQGVK